MANYETVRIGDVARLLRGVTYKKEVAADAPAKGLVPLLRATNIQTEIDFDEMVYVPRDCVSDEQHLQQGDIVLAASSGSLSVVGKSAIVRHQWDGTFGAFCYALRADPTLIDPFYLSYFLKTSDYRTRVAMLAAGVNINNLKREHLEGFEIPLAPLPEQHRIVEAIESYFTRLDDAVATLERVQRNLKRYRASVLKAAVEGRLVPTEAGHRGGGTRDAETSPGLDILPPEWVWAPLRDVCASITDGDHQPPPQAASGIPFLVIGDVKTGEIDYSTCRYVPSDYFGRLADKRKPVGGDVLYTVTGSYGIPVRVRGNRPFCVQRHIAILRPADVIDQSYLFYALQSDSVLNQANAVATGTAQKTVGLQSLREMRIPLPPIKTQVSIVHAVDELFSSADSIERQARLSIARCRTLRQSILKWAFEGRLVDQDPSDEPASVLLERIKAERAAPAGPRTRRQRKPRASKDVE